MSFPSLYLKICAPPPTKLSLPDPCLPSVGATSHCVIDVLFCPGSRLSQCTLLSPGHGHTLVFVVLYMRNVFLEGSTDDINDQELKCLRRHRSNVLHCQHAVLQGLAVKLFNYKIQKVGFFSHLSAFYLHNRKLLASEYTDCARFSYFLIFFSCPFQFSLPSYLCSNLRKRGLNI